jgi:hypothetical protein
MACPRQQALEVQVDSSYVQSRPNPIIYGAVDATVSDGTSSTIIQWFADTKLRFFPARYRRGVERQPPSSRPSCEPDTRRSWAFQSSRHCGNPYVFCIPQLREWRGLLSQLRLLVLRRRDHLIPVDKVTWRTVEQHQDVCRWLNSSNTAIPGDCRRNCHRPEKDIRRSKGCPCERAV